MCVRSKLKWAWAAKEATAEFTTKGRKTNNQRLKKQPDKVFVRHTFGLLWGRRKHQQLARPLKATLTILQTFFWLAAACKQTI